MKTHPIAIFCLLPLVVAAQSARAQDYGQLATDIARYESGGNMAGIRAFESLVRESAQKPALRKSLESALIKVLSGDATFEGKRFACQNLAVLGSDEALPVLAKLLESEETAGIACLALGAYPSGKAGQALRAALGTSKGASRAQIINTLGDRRDAESVSALASIARDKETAVAEAAVVALAKIGNAEATAAIDGLRNEAPSGLATALTDASLRIAAQIAAAGDRDAAIRIYQEYCGPANPPHLRRAAFAALLRQDRDGGARRIIEMLHGDDAILKPAAIAGIASLDMPGASERFSAEMVGLKPDVQILLMGALVARGDEGARRGVAAQVENTDPQVALAAIRYLGIMGHASFVPPLIKIASKPASPEHSEAALLSLQQLKGDAPNEAILAAARTSPAEARTGLLGVLVARRTTGAVPFLIEQAADPDARIASAALKGIGKLATPDRLPQLVDMLAALARPELEKDLCAAIVQLSRKIEDPNARSQSILAGYRKASATSVRAAMLRAMADTAGTEALEVALAAMADPDKTVAEAATRAVANWSDPAAAPSLLARAQASTEPTAKILLLRGAIRLLARAETRPANAVIADYADALKIATRSEEKQMVISGLSSYPVAGSLAFLAPLLEDPELRADVAPAIVRIAKTHPAIDPAMAKSLLPKATAAMAAPAPVQGAANQPK